MRKLFLAFTLLAVILAGLIVGAGYAFKSNIEDIAKNTLLNLMGPGESSIEEVAFNPLSRTITAAGWNSTYTSSNETFHARIARASGTLSLRGLLSYLPLLDNLFFSKEDFVPVIKDLTLAECFWQGEDLAVSASQLALGTIELSYPLARLYYQGSRPPFIELVDGFRADAAVIDNVAVTDAASPAAPLLRTAKIELQNILGASAASVRIQGLSCQNLAPSWTVSALTFSNVHISPELFSELVACDQLPDDVFSPSFQKSLNDNGRIFSQATAQDVFCRSGADNLFTVSHCTLDWTDSDKTKFDMKIADANIAPSVLPEDLASGFAGMKAIRLDGTMQFASQDPAVKRSDNKTPARLAASLHLKDLGDLDCSILLGIEQFFSETALNWDVSCLKGTTVKWQDHGLTARLAHAISPVPHLASMALKAGIMSLCADGTAKEQELCERLASFVDRPGTLTVTFIKDTGQSQSPGSTDKLPIDKLPADKIPTDRLPIDKFSGDCLIDIQTIPGSKSLTEQSEALFKTLEKNSQ